jgi:hypothetical protein
VISPARAFEFLSSASSLNFIQKLIIRAKIAKYKLLLWGVKIMKNLF